MFRVVPDDTNDAEQLGEEGGNVTRFSRGQILTGLLEERDKLEAVLCTELTVLESKEEG